MVCLDRQLKSPLRGSSSCCTATGQPTGSALYQMPDAFMVVSHDTRLLTCFQWHLLPKQQHSSISGSVGSLRQQPASGASADAGFSPQLHSIESRSLLRHLMTCTFSWTQLGSSPGYQCSTPESQIAHQTGSLSPARQQLSRLWCSCYGK